MTEDSAVKDFLEILEVRCRAGVCLWRVGVDKNFVGTIATNWPPRRSGVIHACVETLSADVATNREEIRKGARRALKGLAIMELE